MAHEVEDEEEVEEVTETEEVEEVGTDEVEVGTGEVKVIVGLVVEVEVGLKRTSVIFFFLCSKKIKFPYSYVH